MSSDSVLVTYAAPSTFLSSDHWKQFQSAFLAQLPLQNIHWKSSSRPSIRTIQQVNIKLVPIDSVRDEQTTQIPLTVIERPLLNLYIVVCEDNEAYKNVVRKQIKDWHSSVIQRKGQEWLILYMDRPDTKAAATSFFQVKASVLDKIKADFNVDKRDRCVQVAWSPNFDNPATWADVITKVKEGILSAFDASVTQREEEVKRSENQRQMPGWNFCTFFILKESLASSFEAVGLYEDAIVQYDELEASFYQVLREKNLSWFGTLISPGPNDDSIPLLSTTKKPYRDLILANTISVFDFRVYLVARQCTLLGKMGKVVDVGRKSSAFLSAFGKRLLEAKETVPLGFVESWIYSSALSVVEQCDEWALDLQLEESHVATFDATKGELLELARHQLDTLGVQLQYLPLKSPFSTSSFLSPEQLSRHADASDYVISRPDLVSSLKDKETFYDLYIKVTNRAIERYAKARRRKFALKLHGSLAALDVHRGRLPAALQTFTSLPAHYAPHEWTSLESLALSEAMATHARLEKAKDTEWIHILLAFLKTYVGSSEDELLIQTENNTSYMQTLIDALRHAAEGLDTDLLHADNDMLSVRIHCNDIENAETQDGSYLGIAVTNHLPCDIPADEVSVILTGPESEKLRYSTKIASLASGITTLKLFCPMPSNGTHALDSTEIRISRLLLQRQYRPNGGSTQKPRLLKYLPVLVHVPKDFRSLNVSARQPDSIELGKPPRLLISMSTGRNSLSNAKLRLSSSSGAHFDCKSAIPQGDVISTFELQEDSITLKDTEKDVVVSFLIPYTEAPAFQALTVVMDVEYVTASEPDLTRTLHTARLVPTSLPVAVNVQDFFRGPRLFSQFTVSTTSHQFVRIQSAQLSVVGDNPDDVAIEGCGGTRNIVTVTPVQPGNFLFRLISKHGLLQDPLRFTITYRMLRDEVELLVKHAIDDLARENQVNASDVPSLVDASLSVLQADSSWIEPYVVTRVLRIPDVDVPDELSGRLPMVLEEKSKEPLDEGWREICIPVDIPRMNIIAGARIRIPPDPFSKGGSQPTKPVPLYAGQPIPAELTISTSFHWGGGKESKDKAYRMRFDVEELIKEWLVSGRKRGDFAAKDGETYTVPITLIALHHGELALPKVSVTPLPLGGEFAMGSLALPSTETYQMHGAEKVLVLPRGGRSTFILDMGTDPAP
ncbi:hypothetical protein OE88DRAFT_1732249 [Heliocybe sulcata]|uniref:Trafficking protein particle complex subunit 10 n=1 Tax=Heliocybe sulcata TaxID=5364 RepID=A0A5C3NCB5_9AGAM|nr:hypothetical protein OE88DRAFT_1732249 [Heliocybe sulcata]